jgi:hypothetical protein
LLLGVLLLNLFGVRDYRIGIIVKATPSDSCLDVLVLEIVFQLFYFDPFLMWLAHYSCFNSKS